MVQQVVAVEQTAIKQAFYNTVANLFLILTLWAFFVLYFVFEQFVRPLLWGISPSIPNLILYFYFFLFLFI